MTDAQPTNRQLAYLVAARLVEYVGLNHSIGREGYLQFFMREIERALAAKERPSWRPIDKHTPRNRIVEVYAPEREGFGPFVSLCRWHPDAGFCIHEICEPTHWREHEPPESAPADATSERKPHAG